MTVPKCTNYLDDEDRICGNPIPGKFCSECGAEPETETPDVHTLLDGATHVAVVVKDTTANIVQSAVGTAQDFTSRVVQTVRSDAPAPDAHVEEPTMTDQPITQSQLETAIKTAKDELRVELSEAYGDMLAEQAGRITGVDQNIRSFVAGDFAQVSRKATSAHGRADEAYDVLSTTAALMREMLGKIPEIAASATAAAVREVLAVQQAQPSHEDQPAPADAPPTVTPVEEPPAPQQVDAVAPETAEPAPAAPPPNLAPQPKTAKEIMLERLSKSQS